MLSGLHPDAASPPRNPGRADDVSFVYGDYALPLGSPVLFRKRPTVDRVMQRSAGLRSAKRPPAATRQPTVRPAART